MKSAALFIFAAFLGVSTAVASGPTTPFRRAPARDCTTYSSEIFVSVEGEGSIKIRISDLDDGGTVVYLSDAFSDGEEGAHESARWDSCEDFEWIASTDDYDTAGVNEVQDIDPHVLYKIEILEGTTTKASFTFYECSGANPDPFYCPDMTGGDENDFFIIYDTDTDSYDFFPVSHDDPAKYSSVNDTFSADSNWLWPLDRDTFCSKNDQHNSGCIVKHSGFFLTPQAADTIWTHTAEDLLIMGGSTWGDELSLSGNHDLVFPTGYGIEIEAGSKLTLKDTLTFHLPANADVHAVGEIVVDGTAGGPVTFRKSGASNWGEVHLSGEGADGSSFDFVVFDQGSYCLYLNGVDDVVVTNSTFDTCGSGGVRFISSTGLVFKNNFIDDSQGHGVDIDGGSLRLEGNTISNFAWTGLSVDQAFVGLYGDNDGPGDNIIETGDWGIYGDEAAVDAGDHSNGYGGDNSIYSTNDERVYAINDSEIFAEDNWWGTSSPPSSYYYADGSSTLVYAFPLSSDPNASKGGSARAAIASEDLKLILEGDSSPGSSGRFVRAINKLRQKEGREVTAGILSRIVKDKTHPQRGIAARYYVSDLAHTGSLLLAVMRGEEYLVDETMSLKSKSKIARELFSVYTDTVKSLSGAGRMRALLELYEHRDFETGLISKLEERFATSLGRTVSAGKRGGITEGFQKYIELDVNAYPNPFHGSTRIEFTVEEPSDVELIVYDILGRQVKQLVKAPLSEGYYNFRFDAANLARGFYFYRLRSGNTMKTGKLIYAQ